MNDQDEPWYKDGLRFKCTGCGDCCTGAPGYVWVNKVEIAALASQVGMAIAEFEAKYVRDVGVRKSLKEYSNGDCVFFDGKTRKCRVYSARPRQCRTWPFWDSNFAPLRHGLNVHRCAPAAARARSISSSRSNRRRRPFASEATRRGINGQLWQN